MQFLDESLLAEMLRPMVTMARRPSGTQETTTPMRKRMESIQKYPTKNEITKKTRAMATPIPVI
jgi:hypothetical protein